MTLQYTVIFIRWSHFAAHKHNNTNESAVGGDWRVLSLGSLGLSALQQVKVFFFGRNIWAVMQQQLSRDLLSVTNRAEMMNFAVISDASKRLKGIIQPGNISSFQHAGPSWCLFYTFIKKKKEKRPMHFLQPCHRSEIEMMRRFKSVRSDCASGARWNMEQLIQGVEVLMCSSGQNFIALHNSEANNKGGGWMFLLVAAVCLWGHVAIPSH